MAKLSACFGRTLDGTSTVYSPVEEDVLKRFIADEGLSFDQKINLMMVDNTSNGKWCIFDNVSGSDKRFCS